ncbi:uncharacterized protein PHACADRAFT_255750, partial [Phanerochaete carnosa HHB-10118-sp]
MNTSTPIKRTEASTRPLRKADPKYDMLNLKEEVVLVFVHLNLSGAPSESDEAIWWPARVIDRGEPLRVAPFGKHPGWSSRKEPHAALTLPSRAPQFIMPYRSGPTQLRFDEKTFAPSGHAASLALSPHKKRRTDEPDLVARWSEARDLLLRAYQDANDGMPLSLSRYIVDVSPPLQGEYTRETSDISLDLGSDEPSGKTGSWRAPSANFMYDIPGELVLAKERKRDTQYWPAKIMKYHPPKNPKEKPRYEIMYYEGTVKNLPDDEGMFYTPAHEGFKTCMLGDAEDDYGLNEGNRDEDDESAPQADPLDEETEEQLRAPSPPPTLPAPTAFGYELTIPEQFNYVKPVLVALMNGRYEPSLARHTSFMKDGRSRRSVMLDAWKRGELSPSDKDELDVCIRRWMRKRSRRQQLGLVPADELVLVKDEAQGQSDVPASKGSLEAVPPVLDLDLDLDLESVVAGGAAESVFSDIQPPSSSLATIDSIRTNVTTCNESMSDTHGAQADSSVPDRSVSRLQDITPVRATTDAIKVDDGAVSTILHNKPDDPTSRHDRKDETTAGPLPTYAELSPLDQITYCTSVLLPEAILQLLLWRNGYRETPEPASAEEEARLYKIARDKADATDWVHDIIRM